MTVANIEMIDSANLSLIGDLTFKTVTVLQGKAIRRVIEGADQQQINLKELSRVDSAGLALLLELLRVAKQQSKTLSFIKAPRQLVAMAKVSGVDGFLF